MTYVIGAGVLTSIVAIAGLVMIVLQPFNYIFSTIFTGGTKFYIVSVLARLNSRSPPKTFSVIDDASELSRMSSSRFSNTRLWTTAAEPFPYGPTFESARFTGAHKG
ncbi:hypothetical protein L218DRAFT_965560 [Marasmius fiardii PR-910]|nr:hypothetical protein L218DRAFT_965560 [Marasmius fiardii PR-910]